MSLDSVHHLNLTLPTPEENLACDEALLDAAEADGGSGVLRFWESATHFVVLGYAGKTSEEADLSACEKAGVQIYRRCSGGGTVLQGPGCLNYSLVLPIEETGPTGTIPATNRFVMECNARALSSVLGRIARVEGHTDLAVNGLKFSGNAQRRRRRWLLFHGTFLINYDAALMERLLRPPPRQPAYRMNRRHSDFLMQIDAPRDTVKSALCRAWNATLPASNIPFSAMARLVAEKYSKPEWNLRW